MKKLVSVQEVEGEGLVKFLGERVILICEGYFYAGKLAGVNDKFCMLEDAELVFGVFGAGEWSKNKGGKWAESEKIGRPAYVFLDKIEAFWEV